MKQFFSATRLLAIAFLLIAFQSFVAPRGEKKESSSVKISSLGVYKGYSQPVYKGFNYSSRYITMRDGVRIAVDVYLPKKMKDNEHFPTIIYLTRYVRSLQAKFPFNLLKDPVLVVVSQEEIDYFTSYGYACVIADVRGSGASFGDRTMEFSPAEVKDGYDLVDWIISQPWSDGKVASTGVSYVGTTAELLLVNKHPAVKACIPRSNIFDLYNHMMFPNGVRQGPFIKIWGTTTQSLDGNNFDIFGKRADRLLKGIHPVENDRKDLLLKEALSTHQNNFNVYEGLFQVNYRDDKQPGTELCSNDYSIHANRKAIEQSGAAIYRIDGWYDGALCKSAIEGYLNTSNTQRVLIGPWDHGPHGDVSPFSNTKEVTFDVKAEMLRFFDHYLKGIDNGIDREKKFNYFTVGEEKWKASDSWPLPQQTNITYYFSADKKLVTDSTRIEKGSVNYTIDYTVSSGNTSRWNSQTPLYMHGYTNYPDRKELDSRLMNFTAQPFLNDVEVTGQVIADIYMSADASDADVFCYVEDVAPNGSVTYVTEGLFRALHRKIGDNPEEYKQVGPYHSFKKEDAEPLKPGENARLQFDLLPISYLFKEGHSLRLSIAGADADHFDFPDDKPTKLAMNCGVFPSSISIPVLKRGEDSKF